MLSAKVKRCLHRGYACKKHRTVWAARFNGEIIVKNLNSQTIKVLFAVSVCLSALLSALPARADKPAKAKQTQSQPFVIAAQGHPKYLDFVARSSKRVDLRMNVQRKGLDAAFTDWVCEEHSHVYQEYAANLARQSQVKAIQKTDKIADR